MTEVKIELLEGGFAPVKSTEGAAAYDCFAREIKWYEEKGYLGVKLGFKMEIPEGYCAKLYPRSSVSNLLLHLANSVGVIDSDYRGEVEARFYPSFSLAAMVSNINEYNDRLSYLLKPGERVAQIMIEKIEESKLTIVDSLSDTVRGEGGFGSTGF